MTTVTGKLNVSVTAQLTSAPDGGQGVVDLAESLAKVFSNGSGLGKITKAVVDERTIGDGANETVDLYGGLTDAYGATINFTKIKVLLLLTPAGNTTAITFGNASAPFNGPLGVTDDDEPLLVAPAGEGAFLFYNATGWTVANATNDGLKATNGSGAAATYTIVALGE